MVKSSTNKYKRLYYILNETACKIFLSHVPCYLSLQSIKSSFRIQWIFSINLYIFCKTCIKSFQTVYIIYILYIPPPRDITILIYKPRIFYTHNEVPIYKIYYIPLFGYTILYITWYIEPIYIHVNFSAHCYCSVQVHMINDTRTLFVYKFSHRWKIFVWGFIKNRKF